MKVEGELFWGWLSDIAAIAAALLGCQKLNRHAQDSFFHRFSQINCTCAYISAKVFSRMRYL
jgi:hypothetical protein